MNPNIAQLAINQVLEQIVSQIANQVAAQLLPSIQAAQQKGQTSQTESEAIVKLQEENQALTAQMAEVKAEIAELKAELAKQTSSPVEPESNGQVEDQQPESNVKVEQHVKPQPSKAEAVSGDVDEQKAENWARENTDQWLDEPCRFSKAAGRSWRQLAQDVGENIAMGGRAQSPRAYLHAIESWKQCHVWSRVKAKVALDLMKNGTG